MRIIYLVIISVFVLYLNSFSQKMKLPINGLWTNERPPFGVDTLIISDSTLYYKFRCCDTIKVEWFGKIISQNSSDYILVKRTKVLHNFRNVAFNDSLIYFQYELTDKNLWTYSQMGYLPNRNYLKINAYRTTWKSKDWDKYKSNSFGNCDRKIMYSVYSFQDDIQSIPFVTIPPKYKYGNDSLKKYIENKLIYSKEDVKDIFLRLKYRFTVNCDGRISDFQNITTDFPNLSVQLKTILESIVEWIPAVSESHYVTSQTFIYLNIKDGEIIPSYIY